MVDSVRVGDRVRWTSADGTLRGEISEIRLNKNADGKLIPWVFIDYIQDNMTKTAMLAGTEANLSLMKFQVNFRDQE